MSDDNTPLTREAVTTELQKSQTDPSHPQYENSRYHHDKYSQWADGLYKRIGPASTSSTGETPTQSPIVRGEFIDASPSNEVTDAAFRSSVAEAVKESGIDVNVANEEGKHLFSGATGAALLDVLEQRTLLGLAPQAEVQAHVVMGSFLSDLNALRNAAPVSTPPPTGEAFQAALSAALKEKGMSLTGLQDLEDHIFNGKPELYEHMLKYIDSFPPSQKLAVHVRCAEALMRWQGLMQSQT